MPWQPLAEAALAAATSDDEELLVNAMIEILETHGLRYIEDMMLSWADACRHPHADAVVAADGGFQFHDARTGATSSVQDSVAETQWAGKFLIARWTGDDAGVKALLLSVQGTHELMVRATIVLQMCGHLARIMQTTLDDPMWDRSAGTPKWVTLASEALTAEITGEQLLANELTLTLLLVVEPEQHIEVVYLWGALTDKVIDKVRGGHEVNWAGEGCTWVDDYLRASRAQDLDAMHLIITAQCGKMSAQELVTVFRQGCGARIRLQVDTS